ncbi:hypothetical protein [Affinirhizobium pseudoryzae]|jgi:hypothetical protein|uniref:hypothetical protein n=1 Tax=Allorhizobium pseudoryzae TaxID=379684 RepID=UPI0013ECB36C|nr:hypothetical protein [Allorhizobium pseudoryzae]
MSLRHLVAGCLFVLAGSSAAAHDYTPPADQSGYAIPSIDHGAMRVIADFRSEIIDLARQVTVADPELQALLLHNQMQAANCLWLLVPGSVTDEESPLNECAHADLAGLKGILDRLRLIPQTQPAADALVSTIDHAMVLAGTSFIKCEYSAESFNTASQVRPNWVDVAGYVSSRHALSMGFVFALLVLGFFLCHEAIRAIQKRPKRSGNLADH